MRLGVDFGTTRIVAARVDRGNYPVIQFDSPDGEPWDGFPALIASRGGQLLFGFDAWRAQAEPDATVLRSIKRFLQDAGPDTGVEIGSRQWPMLDLLTGLASAFRAALAEASSINPKGNEPFEILLGVPANANGNQRFLTTEAFRRTGFDVLGLLNEPSAASIEYGHSIRGRKGARDTIIVYDLGGGTFDASLVELDEQRHEVLASEGIPTLGGDDFDELLASLALDEAGIGQPVRESLSQAEWFRLHEECRQKKEALHPNTRRIAVDLEQVREGWPAVAVPAAAFYAQCEPLVLETVHAVDDLSSGREGAIEAVYVAGGASELPLVSRALKERFGRRVRRSSYARSATAIGLAIQADAQAGYVLRERFTRNFGVWREAEDGAVMIFDPLFLKGTPLPGAGDPPLRVARDYYPAHNVGHFRYLECSHTGADGRPAGDLTLWDEIRFPFDPAYRDEADLAKVPVVRQPGVPACEVREEYCCDAGGAVTVTIANVSAGYERVYRLGRWAMAQTPIVPGPPVKRARRAAPRKP